MISGIWYHTPIFVHKQAYSGFFYLGRDKTHHETRSKTRPDLGPGGGGGYSPHLMVGGGVRPEKIYRGVRELLFIPKKGGLEN